MRKPARGLHGPFAKRAAYRGLNWSSAISAFVALLGSQFRRREALSLERIVTALYRGILEREADPAGFRDNVHHLRSGQSLERVVRSFVTSPEFRSLFVRSSAPAAPIPDLRASMPER